MSTTITIYTDGACVANGQPHASAAYSFACPNTGYSEADDGGWHGKSTNNTAEILGIIHGIIYAASLTPRPKKIEVFSDSEYAIGSLVAWKLTPKKKNYQLIAFGKKIIQAVGIPVEIKWIKGHSGDVWNEAADKMAEKQAAEFQKIKSLSLYNF